MELSNALKYDVQEPSYDEHENRYDREGPKNTEPLIFIGAVFIS
jgi:hypothetical protein